jgi:hypothetical protein
VTELRVEIHELVGNSIAPTAYYTDPFEVVLKLDDGQELRVKAEDGMFHIRTPEGRIVISPRSDNVISIVNYQRWGPA